MKHVQLLICVGILGVAGLVMAAIQLTKPEARKAPEDKVRPAVEVLPVRKMDYRLTLPSQGVIEPARQTSLASEVSGKVTWVAPAFKAGGEFKEGDAMVRIDPADFKAVLASAQSELADAELNLQTEEARAEQALRDWKALGRGGEPTDLVVRKPQLASARARIEAARASVAMAQRDLERSEIKAPYDLRVQRIRTELGSYLSPAAPVAEVYAVAPFEIRLPLSLEAYVNLAEGETGPAAELTAHIGGREYQWQAEIVRTEGQVDRNSRSIYLVGRVQGDHADSAMLQPGLFVTAKITGRVLEDVVPVPLRAFQGLETVVLVSEEDTIHLQEVGVLWREGDIALVNGELKEGERICVTPLEVVIEGTEVNVTGQATLPLQAAQPVPGPKT